MARPALAHHRTRLLYAGYYLTLAGVAATGLSRYFTDGEYLRWAAAGLTIAFSLLGVSSQWPINLLSRYPHPYLAVQSGLVLALLLLPPQITTWAVLYFIHSVQAMLLLSQRTGFIWIDVFTLAMGAGMVDANGWFEGLTHVPLFAGGYFFFGTFAAATARCESDRQRSESLLVELEKANRRLMEYAAQAEEVAAVQECSRIARDLHDSVTQTVFSMTLAAQSARILLDREPSKVEAQLQRLQGLAEGRWPRCGLSFSSFVLPPWGNKDWSQLCAGMWTRWRAGMAWPWRSA